MASIELRNIVKRFGNVETIHGVDLQINDGELVVFVGPSGCGKSTLLRLIAGLEDISGGDLFIDSDRVNDQEPKERGIAMVFQSYALYPHMSVYENIAFSLRLSKMPDNEIEARVAQAAKTLQLDQLLDRLPKQLSGGQRQRVAIGRAIVRGPRVFLFDEPLSNLDASLRVQMRIEIARLHADLQATMVYVTHDQVEAMTLADRIVVLSAGRIEQVGAPLELYHHPRNLFVAGFIGSPKMNLFPGSLTSGGSETSEVNVQGAQHSAMVDASQGQAGDKIYLGVRPEHLNVATSGEGLSGEVVTVEHLGDATLVYAKVDGLDDLVTASLPPQLDLSRGQSVVLQPDPAHSHIFNAEGIAYKRSVDPLQEQRSAAA